MVVEGVGSYSTLTEALTHAPAGATITVNGVHSEQTYVNTDGLNITGIGAVIEDNITINGNGVVLKDMEIRNVNGTGVRVNGVDVTLDNLNVHHCQGSGIFLSGNYGTVQNCQVWQNSQMHASGAGEAWASGISAARYPIGCVIRGCDVYENWGEGISTFEAENTTIEGCRSHDNQIQYYISDVKGAIVQRNLAYCTPGNTIGQYYAGQWGILLNDEKGFLNADGQRERSSNNTIVNNIVHDSPRSFGLAPECGRNLLVAHNTFVNAIAFGLFFYAGELDPGARFINNLIAGDAMSNINPVNLAVSNNLWPALPLDNLRGVGDVTGNPLLDSEYKPHALAQEAGKDIGVMLDFGGNVRNTKPTIGAWE